MADDQIVALGDTEDDAYDSLAGTIKAKFQASENARQFDEKRWLTKKIIRRILCHNQL